MRYGKRLRAGFRSITLVVLVYVANVFAGAENGPARRATRTSGVAASTLAGVNFDLSNRTQRFRYDPEASYAILGLPGVPTDIQLAPGEHVTGFALGDTVQWLVEELQGHIFVKPLRSDLFTAGTLVTDRHSYQLTLKSGHPRDEWMQRVSWTYPDVVLLRRPSQAFPHGAERIDPGAASSAHPSEREELALEAGSLHESVEGARASTVESVRGTPQLGYAGLDPKDLNFDYRVSGEGSFKPVAVFDDGHALWLRMPARTALPALFQDGEDGVQLIHYAVRGEWLVVPRLAAQLILKLGRSEVRVERTGSGRPNSGVEGEHDRFWR